MYKDTKPKIIFKQFTLPSDEEYLNMIYNKPNIVLIDEKIFQNKIGDAVVVLKYELYPEDSDNNEEIEENKELKATLDSKDVGEKNEQ